MKRTSLIQFLSLLSAVYLFVSSCITSDQVKVTGEMKVWHTITFTFTGPESSEFDTINPFTDYRLDVGFTNGKQEIYVPGYFAADGNAAESSARSGNKWRVHFCPPADGTWSYKVTFLKGGTDSPENFLAYREFDGTYYGGRNIARSGEAVPNKGLHLYEPHTGDWREGDPQWKNGRGKGIIGALNYLSSKGIK